MKAEMTTKKNLLDDTKSEQIRLAIKELKFAEARIYGAATGVQSFRLSKLLNVMGKILQDYFLMLSQIVGDRDIDLKDFELSFDSPPLKLYKLLVEEDLK